MNTISNSTSNNYNDELADKITLLAGQINAANYRFLKLLGEFDRLEAWAGYGIRSCAHWLNWKCGISFGTAREKVRVARAMESLDGISTAFSTGEISYSKVRAMTRVATASNEEYLLMIAQYGTAVTLAGSERCQLMLHIHEGSNISDNLDGRWLPTEAAKCLSCDASLVVIEEDEVGNVLNIGRRSRIIPAGMSRALSVRDHGHCQFPGCCESHYVEGHHIKHWGDGDETTLDNLVTLCRYHHRELHKGNFYLSVKPESSGSKANNSRFAERLVFSRCRKGLKGQPYAEGESIIEANPACPNRNCTELPWSICKDIGIKTAITRWLGERMDLEMAVDGLMSKTYRH